MTFSPLPRSIFAPSARVVARRLLGHWLVRRTPAGFCGGPIVETEAYLHDDPACHAFGGETARNRVMFGPPGRAYVYFIYGNHFCVNAVCRGAGKAEAVLIRAVEAQFGLEILRQNRPGHADLQLTNGPGKLCAALAIGRELDGADLCDTASPSSWPATQTPARCAARASRSWSPAASASPKRPICRCVSPWKAAATSPGTWRINPPRQGACRAGAQRRRETPSSSDFFRGNRVRARQSLALPGWKGGPKSCHPARATSRQRPGPGGCLPGSIREFSCAG